MKHILTLIFLAITALSFAEDIPGRVISVHDGDTYTMQDNQGNKIKVRQLGIDAPELKQPYGIESRDFSKYLILNQRIILHKTKTDMYGRTLGRTTVITDGKYYDVEASMLYYGWAWHYKAYNKEESLSTKEEEARKARRGLWKDDNPTPPWEFRKAKK